MDRADSPSKEGLGAAAWLLMCEVRALWAVSKVESGAQGAFLPSGEPVILYERHLFHELTGGKFDGARAAGVDQEFSVLSSASPGGHGPVSAQHAKLAAAQKLDRGAALMSCSWGLYQVLGKNHWLCGFGTRQGDGGLQRFVNAMCRSADDHLRALVVFLRRDDRLVDALRDRDWPAFACAYNGPRYADRGYDQRLADAYGSLT